MAKAPATGEAAPLTEADALAFVESIKSRIGDLRDMLIELHDRFGWRSLGYDSWEKCVAEEFKDYGGQRYMDMQLFAGRIQRQLPPPTGQTGRTIVPTPVPETHLRPLGKLPEDQQVPAYLDAKEKAEKAGKPLTAAAVKAQVDLYLDDEEPYVEPPEPEEPPPEPTLEENMAASNKRLESLARSITAHHKEAVALAEGHLDDERLNVLLSQLKSAANTVRCAKGAGECSYCGGEGCDPCEQTGWLTKVQLASAPERSE